MSGAFFPVATLATSLVAAAVFFLLPEGAFRARTGLNLAAAVLKIGLVAWMVRGLSQGNAYAVEFPVLEGLAFVLRADPLGIMFAGLSSLLWLFTTIYAIGYLEDSPNRRRFFGFFSLCVASTLGISLAGNLFTFLIFYELLTLSTYPLVAHRGTPKALAAATLYLRFTLTAGLVLMIGMVALHALAGDIRFGQREILAEFGPEQRGVPVSYTHLTLPTKRIV